MDLGMQRRDRKLWTTIAERLEADVAVLQLTLVELEEMLKQLMTVALPNPRIRGDEIAALITALAQILPLSSGLLCSEFARFVQKCCSRERVQFSSAQLKVVMRFFLTFIKTCPSWYTASSVRALGQVLHDNADRASVEFDLLFTVLLKHLDPSGVDIEARYAATSCMSNICTQAGKTPDVYHYFSSLLRMVVENFRQQALSLTKGQDDRILVKACTSSMKCIFTIIVSNFDRLSDLIVATLPSLLTSMRQVVGYGLVLKNDQNDVVFSCQEELHPSDSDSSVCGSDGSAGGRQVGDGLLARLRISVLYTLEAIAQHFPKSITSSMGLYLPEQTTPYMTLFNNTPSVLTLLIADPSEKARMTAAKFLDVFWDKIPLKMYFRRSSSSGATSVAPTSSMSFASMPKRISLMLYQVHVTLVYCIQHEKESAPLAQILKSTAGVHRPWCANGQFVVSFVEELLLLASRPDDSSRTLLRLEAMSLLSKVAKNYSPALSANWQKLAEFMLAAFQDMDANVRLQAVKILENYIKGENSRAEGAVSGNLVAQDSSRVGCLDFMATHLIRAFTTPRTMFVPCGDCATGVPNTQCVRFFLPIGASSHVGRTGDRVGLEGRDRVSLQEQLETQLSFTLVHLIHVATEEDDPLILEALRAKPRGFLYDWLLHNLHRMIAAIEREGETVAGASASDVNEDSRAGGTGDAHDVNPIKKEELLSAVRSLLRILERLNTDKAYATSCVSLLYDTKIGLERDVLYSYEDIPFEL
eukprot:jgi/Phyca11/532891/estExt2_fgenesh1_pg.C_PHYCAscaffold_90036